MEHLSFLEKLKRHLCRHERDNLPMYVAKYFHFSIFMCTKCGAWCLINNTGNGEEIKWFVEYPQMYVDLDQQMAKIEADKNKTRTCRW